jgi:hypothetical protein
MNTLQHKFPSYESFASVSIEDIIEPELRENAFVLQADNFKSTYLENTGESIFKAIPLPMEAQFAPIHGMLVDDVDLDGYLDAICVGNFYGFDASIGHADALTGVLLKGNASGDFTVVQPGISGLFSDGDCRALVRIIIEGENHYLVSRNLQDMLHFRTLSEAKGAYFIPDPGDIFLTLQLPDRSVRKMEFYYGEGYLSQNSRRVKIPDGVTIINVTDYKGNARQYNMKASQ